MPAPLATESALREHIAARLIKSRHTRAVLVRAQPIWSGAGVLTIEGVTVHVVEGISGLAALDAMRTVAPGDVVAVLTDLSEAQLGSAVVVEATPPSITELDEWSFVAGAFGLRDDSIPRPVRELGPWVPRVLAEWRRERGYPQLPPGSVLTPGHVTRALLLALLGLSHSDDLDLSNALAPLDDQTVRERLRLLESDARTGLLKAVIDHVEPHLGIALTAAARPGNVSPIAVGLAAGELWASGAVAVDAAAAAARVRAEEYLGRAPGAPAVQRFGSGSRLITQRWLASGDRHAAEVLEQAEALCAEWGWVAGAAESGFLPSGLRTRVDGFTAAIGAAVAAPSAKTSSLVDDALTSIDAHSLRVLFDGSRQTAQMAARLVRWICAPKVAGAGLGGAFEAYSSDGAWAERALGDLWDGDTDRGLANAYRALALAVQAKRREQDRAAAALLSGAPHVDDRLIPIERLLAHTAVPLSARDRILLIVLDGMSVPTAVELVQELATSDWAEVLPEGKRHRAVALAALPTITEYSRTSLFAGELLAGNQQVEKARFREEFGGEVFHKDALRSEAGFALPTSVTDSIDNPSLKIVAAVLNTIDDALASADVDGLRWTLRSIAKLEALLGAARDAGRLVLLTSDHGHVVERGSELRNVADSSARWRDAGGAPAGDDEVLVEGPRVLAPGGRAILAVSDGLRFASKKAGYHGGASLAELSIPIVVLKPRGTDDPAGWVEAPPQEPTWWNEPSRDEAVPPRSATPAAKPRIKPAMPVVIREPTLFDQVADEPEVAVGATLGARLVGSPAYAARRSSAGRHPLEDDVIITVVDTLVAGTGRAHRDTLAVRLGVAAYAFGGLLTTFRRVLNVDGYPVLDVDADGVTVVLDLALLREQFGLGGS